MVRFLEQRNLVGIEKEPRRAPEITYKKRRKIAKEKA
jgi:hypothetical protein